jgi:hypothetical protein
MPNNDEMIRAIARREGTVKELALRFGLPPSVMRAFAETHAEDIVGVMQADSAPTEPSPVDLDSLWITNKAQRLERLQAVADIAYEDITSGGLVGAELATATREFRSYLMLAANELGQLLHRGAGDSGTGDYLSVEMNGVDMDTMK